MVKAKSATSLLARVVEPARHGAMLSWASQVIREALNLSPIGYWENGDQSQLRIDAYLLASRSVITLPALPMPFIVMQIEGRKVSFSKADGGDGAYIHPSQSVMVPPDVATRWDVGAGNAAIAVTLVADRAEAAIRKILQSATAPTLLNDALLVELMLQMLRISRESRTAARGHGDALIQCLVSHLEWLVGTPPSQRRACGTTNDLAMGRIVGMIGESLDHELTIEALASLAAMSVSQFRKRFKEMTGLSVHQFVLKMRVKRASELITGSTMPIAAIAPECGFSNQSHMTRVLRQELGATPGEMRRSVRAFYTSPMPAPGHTV